VPTFYTYHVLTPCSTALTKIVEALPEIENKKGATPLSIKDVLSDYFYCLRYVQIEFLVRFNGFNGFARRSFLRNLP